MWQEAPAVDTQELLEHPRRHPGLVVGEQGPLDPLDDLVSGRQVVQVHLEAYVLVGQAEAVEQLRVPLRGPHRRGAAVAVQGAPERLGPGDLIFSVRTCRAASRESEPTLTPWTVVLAGIWEPA